MKLAVDRKPRIMPRGFLFSLVSCQQFTFDYGDLSVDDSIKILVSITNA